MSLEANGVPRRWSMLTQSDVAGGSSCRLIAEHELATIDHICACGRLPGKVSGVELREGRVEIVGVERDRGTNRPSVSTSVMRSTSVWNASGRWSRPE